MTDGKRKKSLRWQVLLAIGIIAIVIGLVFAFLPSGTYHPRIQAKSQPTAETGK